MLLIGVGVLIGLPLGIVSAYALEIVRFNRYDDKDYDDEDNCYEDDYDV